MAKDVYKIPHKMGETQLDREIVIQNRDNIGLKPLPIRIVIAYLVSFLALIFLLFNTFITQARFSVKVIFFILSLCMIGLMLSRDDMNKAKYRLVLTAFDYFKPGSRRILTRRKSNPYHFSYLANIKDSMDFDSGLIQFADGSYGFLYQVVGSASRLLFKEDKEMILDRVDNFYKNMDVNCEYIYITVKEPQKVFAQMENLYERYDNLEIKNKELDELFETQFNYLKDVIGKEYKSIHQYLILKSDNKEALRIAQATLYNETSDSSLMFRKTIGLSSEDMTDFYKSIFKKM